MRRLSLPDSTTCTARASLIAILKPENILLQDGIPRLIDFGLATILKQTAQSGEISGTPRYMAPGTFSGRCSPSSDLWSVGDLLYELLTGIHPFASPSLMEMILAIQSRDPAPLPETVPPRLRAVISRLLARSPEERFPSA